MDIEIENFKKIKNELLKMEKISKDKEKIKIQFKRENNKKIYIEVKKVDHYIKIYAETNSKEETVIRETKKIMDEIEKIIKKNIKIRLKIITKNLEIKKSVNTFDKEEVEKKNKKQNVLENILVIFFFITLFSFKNNFLFFMIFLDLVLIFIIEKKFKTKKTLLERESENRINIFVFIVILTSIFCYFK